jgi:signal transduction histidine kinase
VVAHDLRTPLGVAQLKAQVMLRRLPGGAELDVMRRDLDAIRRNTARMARLISDLLDVAAIEAGRLSIRPAAHAVGELLAEAAELVRAVAAERGVTLACRAPAVDAVVVCDRQRVLQVLGNLLGNAVRVAPAGGQVAVEAEVEPERISFAVVDDGPGIPAEERETVFFQWSRGARGKAEKKAGVGLGLFIARGVVRAHGGSIWIEPAAPRGTRVAFALPRAAAL